MDAPTTTGRHGEPPVSASAPTAPGTSSRLRTQGIPEFSDLVLGCRYHLLLTGVIGACVAIGLAVAAWRVVDPRYQSESLVRVREKQNVIFAAQTTRAEDAAFFHSQARLVQSPQVLASALNHESIQAFREEIPSGNPVQWLAGLVQVESETGSELMSITVHHRLPQLAHALCHAVTEAYLAEITERLTHDREQRRQELERAARAADDKLDDLWNELGRVAVTVGSDSSESLTIRDELKFQAYRDHARQLQATQLRGNQLQSQLAELQSRLDQQESGGEEVIETLISKNPEVVAAKKVLSDLDREIEQMQQIAASPDLPQLKRLTDEREHIAAEFDELVTRIRSELGVHSRTKSEAAQQEALAKLRHQIELNRSEKKYLRDRLSEIDSAAPGTMEQIAAPLETNAVPLDIARHAVQRQSRLADGLWQSLQELKIESQSQPRVTLLKSASLLNQVDQPRPLSGIFADCHARQLKFSAAAGLAGCMMVIFLVGYVEWRDCRVRRSDDIATRSRFPVFGAASYPSSASDSRRRSATGGVREAGARILLRDQQGSCTTSVMVTSCAASEPRHLVAQELAMLLGGFRRRVLLVDSDSMEAALSRQLGAAELPGMRQLSMERGPLTEDAVAGLVIPTDENEVDFLPAGGEEAGLEWIDPRTLRTVIEAMRPFYDAVIVNGPSMMGSAESLMLASVVDTTVFAVFRNRSRWSDLLHCEESASQSGLAISGSILHGGKAPASLRLQPDQRGPRARSRRGERVEQELCSQLDELQQEVRRAQSGEKDRSLTGDEFDALEQELRRVQSSEGPGDSTSTQRSTGEPNRI